MSVRHRFEVGDRPRLEVRVTAGRVDVTRAEAGTIAIEVTGPGSDQVEVSQVGGTVVVRRPDGLGRGRIEVAAAVPAGCDLQAVLGAADLRADVDLGDVGIRSAAGEVRLEATDSVAVSVASGDVRVEEVSDRCRVNAASGDLSVGIVGGDLECATASGDIGVDEVSGDVKVKTASGDVRLGRCEGGEIRVSTVSGDTWIGLPPGRRVDVDINTLTGSVRLPDSAERGGGPAPAAAVRLKCVSVSGDVEVRRV